MLCFENGFLMKSWGSFSIFLLAISLLSGCALNKAPTIIYRPGATVETLSSAVSLSISNGDQGMSTSGYMLYKHPDQIRMVILSPFGSTLMEVIVVGENITILDTPAGKAFIGRIDDLPPQGGLENWSHARWVMDVDHNQSNVHEGKIERLNRMGVKELVTFSNGLIESKRLPNGDEARYGDYVAIDGVPLATEIVMENASGKRLRIKLTEPEINTFLATDAFTPRLEGMVPYPLSVLKEK